MVKSYTTFLMFFICTFSCQAQTEKSTDTIIKKRVSNEYIELYDDYFKLRLGFSNGFNSFHIKDKGDNLDFTLTPNQRVRTTFTFIYKFIEIDLGYTPEFISFNKDNDIKGKTKFFNFATRFFSGKWLHNLQFSKTKGFYVDKADIGVSENVLFPNFDVMKIGGSTSYILNPNFSIRSIFVQSEWQKKSAGSFIPSVSYYFTQIKNGNPSKDNIYDFAAGPSYYYNWVIGGNFLVSAGVYGGVGFNYTNTRYSNGLPQENNSGLSLQAQERFTLGYNSKNIYAGVTTSLNSFYYHSDPKIHLQDQQQFFEFYVGYRFKASDKINKFVENNKLLKKK